MGNRCVITTEAGWKNDGIGVYLHWNGGRDSVEAFLKYCELKGYRSPDKDSYGWARLCQVVGNFFGGTNSIGIDTLWHLDLDNGDNGVYIIEGWKITDRRYFEGEEQQGYDMDEMLKEIDSRMPESERLGELLTAEKIKTSDLRIGDTVYFTDWNGATESGVVIGFGEEGRRVNGTDVTGMPYIDRYMSDHPENNINNYLRQGEYAAKRAEEETE